MKEFIIGNNDAGQRLDRFISKAVPLLPPSLLQKYIRLKRIKCNGKPAKRDTRLYLGDMITLYINDEFFETPSEHNAYLRIAAPKLNIVYEDDNLLLVDKVPGMVVHPDEGESVNTLIGHIQAYLYQGGKWHPKAEHSFAPALCNRIDRNTGGIVIAAKNSEALRIMNEKIKNREIEKYYLCIIMGQINPKNGKLENFLFKDAEQNRVYIKNTPVKGAKSAALSYKTLKTSGDLTLVECQLITGRTHQIRAQFAAAGHPLLGDGKYGFDEKNKRYNQKYQALHAYKLVFSFQSPAGCLDYLAGRSFQTGDVDFVCDYFGRESMPAKSH